MGVELETDGGERRVVLVGDVDARCTDRLRAALDAALAAADPVDTDGLVVVDMRRVDCVDLVALRVLAAASYRAGARGRRLVLRSVPPAVRRLLHLSHLIRVVEVEQSGPAEREPA
ncbi:STAS domain-containing protein [Nocardioides sp. CFH 31398]|uniref:STAS domain-containing protein n=1 Tax=Nocardioides sp. CFH 31398 TaxID=2919579 RepID=UPI001F05D47E|nr:STAS domain-containing protein [Nocardioides sp. CFH 31398]MCH1868855.1 STAS domain-containing protein [Nocardioides sp. CFH 31398]